MNVRNARKMQLSRRDFVRSCAAGTAGLAAGSLWGLGPADKRTVSGPAALTYGLDHDWMFGGKVPEGGAELGAAAFETVTLPHCVSKLSWQGWNADDWQAVWQYRRQFSTPAEFANRRVFLKFNGVMEVAELTVNGTAMPVHRGGYLPFEYELTKLLKSGGNTLDLKVDARWLSVPPAGSPKGMHACDYFVPGGIIRGVSVYAVPQMFLSDVFAKPVDVLKATRRVEIACTVDAAAASAGPLHVETKLMDGSRVIASARKEVSVSQAGKTDVAMTLSGLGEIKLWDVDAPHLYEVVTTLSAGGKPIHDYRTRIGFRDASFTVDGFFLNGKKMQFFGLNRHEIYPYVGYAMPARVMRRDAEIMRKELNCNIVRCSHYPQNEAFLDACDELGLMVWQEPPGWQYIGDADFKDQVVENVGDMIRRDRNHAAIVIWGVRINESADDQPLYRRTTALAKSLDDSRPTSGSMTHTNNWQTDWHEDVFAMDDYHQSPDGTVQILAPLPGVPYMLAETVGQRTYTANGFGNMYFRGGPPAVQYKQALYHAQAQDRARAYSRMCGVIAWCAFEYGSPQNSHNGIKNPGVADVFRVPKLGASFYQAQMSPAVKAVIIPNFYWDFGPASPHGPGKDAIIFSNCDRLEVFVNGKAHATLQPDRKGYPNLLHAPFFVDLDLDGTGYPELRIDGYVGGRMALSRSLSADASKDEFHLEADDAAIDGDAIDATRVVFRVTDRYGAPRYLGGGDLTIELTGPGILVGDKVFSLTDSGGVGAVWVKGHAGGVGRVTLKATHATMGSKSVSIDIRADIPTKRI